MTPHLDIVLVQVCDLLVRSRKARPIFLLLVFFSLAPEDCRSEGTKAEGREANRLAGRVDFDEIRLPKLELMALSREHPSGAGGTARCRHCRRLAELRERHEQHSH